MLANFHTHTTFCDGQNTPEEIVLSAIEKGFASLGFSGHGYTPFDERYCMKDTSGYIKEITRLKEKYSKKIEIYCGVEEDAFSPVKRNSFDYIIGSSHYCFINNKYYPIDSGSDYFKKCLQAFNNNSLQFAETYFRTFVQYIKERKPDIVGHFDIITKYEEVDSPVFLNNGEYFKIAEKYLKIAADTDVIFEVNTGAMARGIRTSPYLCEQLLYVLKEKESKLIISSDAHNADNLNACFDETECILRDIGFNCLYELYKGEFKKIYI